MKFYVGLHHPGDSKHFKCAFISVNTLRTRKKAIEADEWIMDSGAFTEISTHGHYRHSVEQYADVINRWASYSASGMIAAVSQDYMCEPFILKKTGLTIADHQRLTIKRYDALLPQVGVYLMPVLQGYSAADYLRHLEMYGDRLAHGAWVGVGSICKRNTDVVVIERILATIKRARPDLRLHGFGLKTTALASAQVLDMLHSADSMAWSYRARIEGRNPNDWREAQRFVEKIHTQKIQHRSVQYPLGI